MEVIVLLISISETSYVSESKRNEKVIVFELCLSSKLKLSVIESGIIGYLFMSEITFFMKCRLFCLKKITLDVANKDCSFVFLRKDQQGC